MLVHDYVQNLLVALPQSTSVDVRFMTGNKYSLVSVAYRENVPMREKCFFIRHADARVYAPQKDAERVLVELSFRHFAVDKNCPNDHPDRFKMTKHGKHDYDLTEEMSVLVSDALAYLLEGKLPKAPFKPAKP